MPHRRRSEVRNDALHVTLHLIDGLPSLRRAEALAAIVEAIRRCQERFECRVIEFAVLSNHLHLIVEAANASRLAQAMKGLKVRIVRALNRLWRRKGSIFRERFHARVLRGFREIKNAVRYVLLNARKHGIPIPRETPDPCSSGPWCRHWFGRGGKPFRSEGSPLGRAKTMYLDMGVYPFQLELNEVPGRWRRELAAEELDLAS